MVPLRVTDSLVLLKQLLVVSFYYSNVYYSVCIFFSRDTRQTFFKRYPHTMSNGTLFITPSNPGEKEKRETLQALTASFKSSGENDSEMCEPVFLPEMSEGKKAAVF